MALKHESVEKNIGFMMVLIIVVISVGGLVQIVPLFFMHSTTEPVEGLLPYSPLTLTGRDIYVREGCYLCHSQMIRPFRAETERYGHYSLAGEFVYDRPFQWGSKRTGPESIMPGYPWLESTVIDNGDIRQKMTVLRDLGAPYTDEEIAGAEAALAGKTELDAVVAYLQGLGTTVKIRR